jgi:hypothetical protein
MNINQINSSGYVCNSSNVPYAFRIGTGPLYTIKWTGSAWQVDELSFSGLCDIVVCTVDGSSYAQTTSRIIIGIQPGIEWQYYGIMVDGSEITGLALQ